MTDDEITIKIKENEITIIGDDAFHISRALRMAKGERIEVSDMQGNQYECVLKEFNPDIIHIHNEFTIGLFGIFASIIIT